MMEITGWNLYWLMKLDSIHDVLLGICVLGWTVLVLLYLIGYAADGIAENEQKSYQRTAKILTVVYFLCALCKVFLPTTNEAAVILIAPKVVNSDFVQKDLPKETQDIYSLAKEYVKNQLTTEKEKK
jgi:hypothetical protein